MCFNWCYPEVSGAKSYCSSFVWLKNLWGRPEKVTTPFFQHSNWTSSVIWGEIRRRSLVDVSLMPDNDSLTLRFRFVGFFTEDEREPQQICTYVSKASKEHNFEVLSFSYYKYISYTGLSQSSTKNSLRNQECSSQGIFGIRNKTIKRTQS